MYKHLIMSCCNAHVSSTFGKPLSDLDLLLLGSSSKQQLPYLALVSPARASAQVLLALLAGTSEFVGASTSEDCDLVRVSATHD